MSAWKGRPTIALQSPQPRPTIPSPREVWGDSVSRKQIATYFETSSTLPRTWRQLLSLENELALTDGCDRGTDADGIPQPSVNGWHCGCGAPIETSRLAETCGGSAHGGQRAAGDRLGPGAAANRCQLFLARRHATLSPRRVFRSRPRLAPRRVAGLEPG